MVTPTVMDLFTRSFWFGSQSDYDGIIGTETQHRGDVHVHVLSCRNSIEYSDPTHYFAGCYTWLLLLTEAVGTAIKIRGFRLIRNRTSDYDISDENE